MTCGESKFLRMHSQAITHPFLPFSSPILLHVGFLHVAEVLYVLSFTFLLIFLIFACLEICFGIVQYVGKEIYIFTTFSWVLPWLGTVFTLLSGQEARNPFLGFITVVFGLMYCHRCLQKSKTRIGFLQRSILALGSH